MDSSEGRLKEVGWWVARERELKACEVKRNNVEVGGTICVSSSTR